MEHINIEKLTRFFYYQFTEGYVFEGHTHSTWEINIILSGKMSITYGRSVMTLSEGDFFIGEPWGFHCNRLMGNGAQMAVINFEKTDAPVGTGNGFFVKSLTQDEFSLVRLMVGELLQKRFDKNTGLCESDYEMCANAKKLCEVLVSRVMGFGRTETENSSPRAQLYREAVEYMEENICLKLTINNIAQILHVSPALLKKVFLEFTGGGVMSFFAQMKIRYARKMLERGKSISVVSDTLGFSSQCYFSTVFSKIVGETPKNYQKRHTAR